MKALVVALLALAAAARCWAADPGLMPLPAANDGCVKRVPGAPERPEYPRDLYDAKVGGWVRLELEFTGPETEPRIRSLDPLRTDATRWLVDAAERFAKSYRHTCMKAGDPPVRVRQDFDFAPNDGRKVAWTVPQFSADAPAGAREVLFNCVRQGEPGSKPYFPRLGGAARATSARVVVQLAFKQLHEPPEVMVLVPGSRVEFTESVLRHVREYRMTCGTPPLVGIQSFTFNGPDEQRVGLSDAPLPKFLAGTRNALHRPVFFDLDRMGCPFEVRMRYWQPYFRNAVGEIGTPHPERRAFLDWLAGLQLDLNEPLASRVAGDELTISVPCGKIDL